MKVKERFFKKLTLVLAALLAAGCGGEAIQSAWLAERIVVDGEPLDWRGTPANYITAPNIEYRVANDTTNLYLLLRTPDRTVAARIVMLGLKVWIDPKTSKRKAMGIGIPKAQREIAPRIFVEGASKESRNEEERKEAKIRDASLQRLAALLDSLADFASLIENGKDACLSREKKVIVSAGSYDEWLLLEIMLPFEVIGIDISHKKSPTIGLGIEIPTIEPRGSDRPGEHQNEDYPQPHTSPPQPRGDAHLERRFFHGLDFWVKIRLAFPRI